TFPAASEDVSAVYRELLKSYKPQQIGIYGCSAGGALSAQVAAWLPAHGLPPQPARSYFDGVDMSDPMVSPALHLGVLAKFPPTLLITGTRAMDLSPA